MKIIRKSAFSTTTCLQSAALAAALIGFSGATAAQAQTAVRANGASCADANNNNVCDDTEGLTANADGSNANAEAIIVTGSRIRQPSNFTSAEPITVITKSEITQQGFNSATDALQSAQITQGSSQINNYYAGFVTNGGTGANTVSLRGLGATRTLVLLNGHRLAPAGTRGSVGSVDTNVLPSALIERIEVLKAGASSIYGSDAIAGVVNIITDRKLKGFVIDAQANVPEVGAGSAYRISGSFGFSGDNWHIIGSAEYYHRDPVRLNDEKFTSCPIVGFLTGAGTALGSGDFIDPATGQSKCFTINNGGVTINTLGVPTRLAQDRVTGATGRFNRLVPDAAVTTGNTPGYSGVTVFTRDSFDPRSQQTFLVTPTQVYTGFVQGGIDTGVLGNAELYFEVLGNRRESSAPLYRQLSLDYARGSLLLPPIFRNGAFLNPTAVSNGQVVAARSFIGYGLTGSDQEVNFYRVSTGLRGDFVLPDWRYDLYGSISGTRARYASESFLTSRVAQSLNVVQNADGSFSCVDPTNGCVAAPAVNASSIGGNLSDAYRNFIVKNVVGRTNFDEKSASFTVDGPLFKLPGGAAQLVLGAEFRHSKINDQPPPESVAGDLYNLTSATPTVGSDEVWETFAEVGLPLLADTPLAYRLNLDGSARYTHYRSYGGQWTYKIAGQYEPVRGLGFRASYGTSYRAPALFEQFLGATSGFLSSNNDPCDNFSASANPTLVKNCLAAGLPADFAQKSGIKVLTAGGAASGLKAETSKNFSAGVIVNPVLPASLGKLSLSADYFSIKIDNGVARAGAANILNLCYSAPTFDPTTGFCRLVTRDVNFAVTVNNNYVNLSTNKVRGFEFNVRYENQVGPGKFVFDALVTKYLQQASKIFPTDPLNDANGIIGSPDWSGSFNAQYRMKHVTFHYGLDWIKGDHSRSYNFVSLDSTGKVDPTTLAFVKGKYFLEVPDYFLHSASVQFDISNFEMTIGVRNLFDKKPPKISSGVFTVIGNAPLYSGYDYTGRTFFVNATAKF